MSKSEVKSQKSEVKSHGSEDRTVDYAALEQEIGREVTPIADSKAAMTRTVELLKARVPDYTWVGIYLCFSNELVLGPFEGKPSPHTRIPVGRGICGAAAAEKATIVVDDVATDPRYLACSVDTKSEIVVPIMRNGNVLGEIDIDSDRPRAFGPDDQRLLERVAALLAEKI